MGNVCAPEHGPNVSPSHEGNSHGLLQTHDSRNTRNVVKGFFQAVANIPTAAEVAEAKGMYLREVIPKRIFRPGFIA
jgi:hypothetical protein